MKLYELTKELSELEAQLDEGMPSDEINSRLDQFSVQFEFKASQIAKLILNYESDISQLKSEEERLACKRKALQNRAENLKLYLKNNMTELGIKTINYETIRVAIQDNPYSVGEVYMEFLPAEFIRVIPEQKEPDKKRILEHFRETGEAPEGAIIERTQRVVIK